MQGFTVIDLVILVVYLAAVLFAQQDLLPCKVDIELEL